MTGIVQGLLAAYSAVSSAVSDAYFNLVTLLLPGNGTNGAQNNTFLDSSTNNFTITRNGNTTQGTFSPFSQTGWGNYLNGDYLAGSTSLFATNTSTFTIEAWLYPTALNSSIGENIVIGDLDPIGATLAIGSYINNSGQVVLAWYDGASKTCVSANTISLNQWSYVAIVVNSNAISMYVNSTTASSLTGTTTLTNRSQTNNFTIGMYAASFRTARWVGYLSNIRVSTVARSISSIPTAPYTSDANTRLLTCQSNRFVDNSSNGFTLTPSGTPSVQAFSPFLPTIPYSAATVGGSGYFDGSGDYLIAPASTDAAFAFGTGDFSIELWTYLPSVSAYGRLFTSSANNSNMDFAGGGAITYFDGGSYSGGTLVANAWQHIVVTRQSGTLRTFLNGVMQANASNSTNLSTNSQYAFAAATNGANTTQQYMAGIRVVKGGIPSAYSTSSTTNGTQIFTPPTAPLTGSESLTAGSVSLLLNYTNAGITDATAKNDLETVGNAQISTTQSKFGGSSMYFDGTGDGLILPATPSFEFRDGDFTVEAWVYIAGNSPLDGNSRRFANIFSVTTSTVFSFNFVIKGDSSTTGTGLEIYNGTSIVGVTGTISQNTWHHVAVSKSGTSVYFFLNGTQLGSTQTGVTGNWGSATVVGQVGRSGVTSYTFDLNGYIDDLRVTKGYARYTANFSVPTAAFALQ